MATPGPDHYMRMLSDAQLRAMLAEPALYGVGERLDADAILRERATFIVRLPDGQCVGRFSVSDPLGPVPAAFAYVWSSRKDALSVARGFAGARVEVSG